MDDTIVKNKHKVDTDFSFDEDFGDGKQYAVILHNDDITPMEFVVYILNKVFGKSMNDAFNLTLFVHTHGQGTAGIYDMDEAYKKVDAVESLKSELGFDLLVTVEESED